MTISAGKLGLRGRLPDMKFGPSAVFPDRHAKLGQHSDPDAAIDFIYRVVHASSLICIVSLQQLYGLQAKSKINIPFGCLLCAGAGGYASLFDERGCDNAVQCVLIHRFKLKCDCTFHPPSRERCGVQRRHEDIVWCLHAHALPSHTGSWVRQSCCVLGECRPDKLLGWLLIALSCNRMQTTLRRTCNSTIMKTTE